MHYQEYGKENASFMLFLHGGGVSSWMWDKQIEYFTHYHCVVPDLPEQGRSINTNFSIKNSAEKLIKLIEEKAKGKKVIVIGFSLGAQITIQMLSIKSDLIDYAMINSPLVRPIQFAKKLIRPFVKLAFPLIKNKTFSKVQAKTLYINQDYFATYYQESCRMQLETLVKILEENMSFKIPNDFKQAKGNILITVGEKEKNIMKKSAIDLVKNNPNCQAVIIPNVGHGVPMAKPNIFNQMIEAWINEGIILEGKVIKC
ncbi:alpha/beta hydrolase [Bacillus aquiflavi]|uniref:Alpha/beta hydrolase n=1 Tax=Bacillus aquiflavi TaxID=2672567 RepID=A0A6B3W012_9BACI|nr:alpha/beta hydrolase [Bacillus aquiflavi]MBA4536557.1 alpha/beta hydrolase [Bacillus aquiflavi]NEY80924.1 alpha/beta hydrolase [Bacillus aquiflavi]